MESELHIQTLGGLQIERDGKPVTGFVSRKVEALFIYMACNPREHPREILAEMLWDDLTQERTMANLRQTLSDLQKQLASYLLVSRQAIGINPDMPYWLDLALLNEALDAADRHYRQKRDYSAGIARQLDEVLDLYHGNFLDGFYVKGARGFDGWRLLEQERARGRVLDALQRLTSYTLKRRLYKDGINYASRWLKLDPLAEEAHRQMMRMLALSGQRSAALAQYETCKQIVMNELELDPEDETVELYEEILAGELEPLEEQATLHNLPVFNTPFVTRPNLQSEIERQITRPECRLLTLTGQGGSGKTRLAVEIASTLLDRFPDGVFFVPLVSATSIEHLVHAIATTLHIDQQGGTLERLLLKYMADKEILLVLDNFETVLDGADMVSKLVQHAPLAKIMVTSLERLNLAEEWVISVGGLDVPETPEADAADYPAVQLFAHHAQRVKPDFNLKDHLEEVVAICQFVSGSPLAIELASSWVRMLTSDQILTEIRKSYDFLTTSLRNIPERHRSMRAVFESSWNMLSDHERAVLSRLAIFRGGFTPDAAQAVCEASPFELSTLTDKSLITVTRGRFALHGLLAQFCETKLKQSHIDKDALHARHTDYYTRFAIANEDALYHNFNNDSMEAFNADEENIMAAWESLLASKNADSAGDMMRPLFFYLGTSNRYQDGAEIMKQAVDALSSQEGVPLARARMLRGWFLQTLARYSEALPYLESSLPILEENRLAMDLRIALTSLGAVHYASGDYETARSYYEPALTYARALNDSSAGMVILFRLSDIATVLGEYGTARRLLKESELWLKDAGTPYERVRFLTTLGDIECKIGDYKDARHAFEEALRISTELGSGVMRGVALVSMGRVAHGLGDYESAISFCRQSIAQCDITRNLWGKSFATTHMARAYYKLDDYTGARYHLNNSLHICDQIGNRWVKAFTLRQLGRRHLYLDSPMPALIESLQIAIEIKALPLVLDALCGLASAFADQDEGMRAYRLALVVERHPVTEHDVRMEARSLLDVLEGALTPSQQQRAEALSTHDTVEALAHQILNELQMMQ